MNGKDDKKGEKATPLSSSQELFEKIFKRATMEIKREKSGEVQTHQPTPKSDPGRRQHQTKTPEIKKSAVKGAGPPTPRKLETAKTPLPVKSERADSNPPPKGMSKTDKKNVKRSGAPKAAVLLVLLALLAGIVSNYMGIIDISLLLNHFGFGPQQVVQAPIPRKQPAKPPEKSAISPKQPQAQEKVSTPPPAPSEPTPPAVSKEEKLAELETPTTIAQVKADGERIEEKAPSVSTTDQPKPPEVSAKQEPQPLPVQTQPSAKPSATEVSPPQPPRTPQYPYSVYLGSHKAPEAVSRALSEYQEKGLSAYWARVDLGDKGVWFRFFTGYFRTKDETEKYIRDHDLQGAEAGVTKFANLIGIYGSDTEVEAQKRALVSAGFYPYVIKAPDGESLLYSGAFDRKEYAEKERSALASKGIRSEVMER